MSHLDLLTAELLLGGVPSVRLGDVTIESSERNRQLAFSEVRSVTNDRGLVRTSDVFENTRTSADTSNYKVVRPGMFVYNPSRINVGSISWLAEDAPVIVSPMYVVFGVDETQLLPAYLMLFLGSRVGRHRVESKTEVGARFRLTYSSLAEIRVPMPSIAVQREVVRTLAVFSQLDAELNLELDARRLQYNHYREQILTVAGVGAHQRRLGDVAKVRYGSDFPKRNQGSAVGEVPFFKVIDMALPGNEVIMVESSNYVSKQEISELRYSPAPAGTVLLPRVGAAVATNKKRMLGVSALFDTSFIALLPNEDLIPRYLLHLLASVNLLDLSNTGAALPSVRRSALEALVVSIPSIAEQLRVVEVLDTFDALVNDRSIGIQAEVNARRKQYEFYRDTLLMFKEVAA